MIRNEYRRAFIMLRSSVPGYSGHVRLERRTLTGSLYFIIAAPDSADALDAAFVGQRDDEYYAAPIGQLRRDRRGQLTLAWHFDPRDVGGRALEAYQWIALAQTNGGCEVVLTGNVEGSYPLDTGALRRAVCALFGAQNEPSADLPSQLDGAQDQSDDGAREESVSDAQLESGAAQTYAKQRQSDADKPREASEAPEATEAAETSDVKIYTGSRARIFTAMKAPAEQTQAAAAEADVHSDAKPAESVPQTQTAAQQLGLDITHAWSGALEPLRRLFATQSASQMPFDDGYTYVCAPMPEGCGYASCCIGLRAEDGAVTSIRYALPGSYAPEPPAGLECYAWTGDGAEGFWTLTVSPEE